MAMPKVVQVIASWHNVGAGAEGNPVRPVFELHTLDGRLIASRDVWSKEGTVTEEIGDPEDRRS